MSFRFVSTCDDKIQGIPKITDGTVKSTKTHKAFINMKQGNAFMF